MDSRKAYVPWRDRAYVSVDEAAQIMARSPDWVRSCVGEGLLHGFRHRKGGPMVIAVCSLVTHLGGNVPARPPASARGRLQLVIDNTT